MTISNEKILPIIKVFKIFDTQILFLILSISNRTGLIMFKYAQFVDHTAYQSVGREFEPQWGRYFHKNVKCLEQWWAASAKVVGQGLHG